MPPGINVAIPTELRDLIVREHAHGRSIEAVVEDALQHQLPLAQAAYAEGHRLSERYLVHPRLATAHTGPTVRVAHATLAAVAELAQLMSDELSRPIPKGRVVQALLWAALAPMTEADRPAPLPPTGSDRLNVNVPRPLYDALLSRALRRTSRDIVVTVDELLARTLMALEDDPALCATLPATLYAHTGSEGTVQTIRYGRAFEPALVQVAQRQFGGIKSRAIAALLWYGLEQPDEPPAELPDRLLRIDAELYARVVVVTNGERGVGRSQAARMFIERAVEDALERAEAAGKKPTAAKGRPARARKEPAR